MQIPTEQAPDCDPSRVLRVIQRRDLQLRRSFAVRRLRHVLEDDVHKVRNVAGRVFPVRPHPAHLGRSVNGREIELLLGGVEGKHQVEDFFLCDFGRAVFLVDFVHHHDGLESQFDGFAQDEACLRHGPFEGVHDEQNGVGHLQHALHFATEVGVTGGVEDVDFDTLPVGAHVFGQDGDAAFALEVVVIED